ncbi:NADP-dependent oxidoreductase [Nonomuraea sp. NPDC050643]|uniref:NADP-dependent oxidoreductase n=1 Tax=Nonomuraea sp. NPDC050643 TaxID=3155660 RepID=UPI0033DEE818
MSLAYGFAAYGGPELQRFLDLPVPDPRPGEVLVEVRAAGVNPVDWKVRAGMQRAFLPLTLPAVLGREVAGTVLRTGPGVTGLAAGDRVFGSTVGGSGGYAERALLPVERAASMPEGLSFTDAAALPIAAATAHDALAALALTAGETLLILGAGGGVGTAAVQLALVGGARVVGLSSAAKQAPVEALGAAAVAYDRDDAPSRLRELLPDGARAVLDLVGGDALHGLTGLLTARTRVISVAAEETRARYGALPLSRTGDTATLSRLAGLVAGGRLDPCVRRVFPFAAAGEALALVEDGHATGKVVIDVTARAEGPDV